MTDELIFSAKEMNPIKIIIIALCVGATVFSVIAVFAATNQVDLPSSSPTDVGVRITDVLRIVHLFVTLLALFMAKFLGDKMLTGKMNVRTRTEEPMNLSMRYRSSVIVRLALLEGATLFGGIVFMQSSEQGSKEPLLYLHFLPLVFLLVAAKSLYPTEQKIADISRTL